MKGNDHQLRKFLIVKQVPQVSTLGNVERTVWRICTLMLGCKGLILFTYLFCCALQPYLRRRKFKLFACFLEATMIASTDGPLEFEVSIGWSRNLF